MQLNKSNRRTSHSPELATTKSKALIKLFSINHDNDIHHLIEIDEKYVLAENDFISLEFDFDWISHTFTCPDCKAFKESLIDMQSAYRWYLHSDNETFLLDLSDFGKNDHFKNFFQTIVSDQFAGVKLKLKKIRLSYLKINLIRLEEESNERYEQCAELRNAISLIKR